MLTLPVLSLAVMSSPREDGDTNVIVLLSEVAQQPLSVDLEIRNAAGGLAGDDWEFASHHLHFSVGSTRMKFWTAPIDDNNVEWVEEFTFKLVNPVGAELGNPSETLISISDNDLAQATMSVEWKTPSGRWEPVLNDEILWSDEEHRWLSSFDPPAGVTVNSIEWLCRPWDQWEADPTIDLENLDTEWGLFTWAPGLQPAGGGMLGELSQGVWAVIARVNFDFGFLVAQAPKKTQVTEIGKVQDVDFGLNYRLVSDPATNGAVTDYTALSEWHDENTNGSVTDSVDGDRRYPLFYTRGDDALLTATFKGNLAGLEATPRVRVRSSHNNIDVQVEADNIGQSSFTATVTFEFHDRIDFLESFELEWSISIDNGETWKSIGTTTHPVYLAFQSPSISGTYYHTVVHLGSAYGKNAENPNSETSVVAAIWDNFSDRQVKTVGIVNWEIYEDMPMKYWGPISLALAEENAVADTVWLLAYQDGKCKAWTNLLEDVLAAQGIGSTQKTIVPKPLSFATRMNKLWIKDYNFNPASAIQKEGYGAVYLVFGGGYSDAAGIAAQSNSDPEVSVFFNHEIVDYNGKIYDPSYGGDPYVDLLAWESASLAAVTFDMVHEGNEEGAIGVQDNSREDTQFE